MLNLFQHLIISVSYETLKQVQGDNYGIMQRSQLSTSCEILNQVQGDSKAIVQSSYNRNFSSPLNCGSSKEQFPVIQSGAGLFIYFRGE